MSTEPPPYYPIQTIEDLERVFAVALSDGMDAIYISGDPLMLGNMRRVLRLVMAARKPSVGPYPEWARSTAAHLLACWMMGE